MKSLVCRYISCCFFILLPIVVVAQHVEKKDSLNEELKKKDYDLQSTELNIVAPIVIPPKSTDAFLMSNREIVPDFSVEKYNNPVKPFHLYSYRFTNPVEGLSMQGMSNRFSIGSFLTADVNFFVSGYFNGLFQPYQYVNGSAQINLTLKLHERVQLVGMGQISLREGIDPKIPTFFGGANYYGGGIQFKVTKKIGFGIGVTNSYYRGSWTKRPYFTPVSY